MNRLRGFLLNGWTSAIAAALILCLAIAGCAGATQEGWDGPGTEGWGTPATEGWETPPTSAPQTVVPVETATPLVTVTPLATATAPRVTPLATATPLPTATPMAATTLTTATPLATATAMAATTLATATPLATATAMAATTLATATSLATATPLAADTSEGQSREMGEYEGVTFVVSEGSEATFTVTEKLASLSLPNDAVMRTMSISGVVRLDGGASVFEIDLHSLSSDQANRDRYVQTRMFGDHPTATFTVPGVLDVPEGFCGRLGGGDAGGGEPGDSWNHVCRWCSTSRCGTMGTGW